MIRVLQAKEGMEAKGQMEVVIKKERKQVLYTVSWTVTKTKQLTISELYSEREVRRDKWLGEANKVAPSDLTRNKQIYEGKKIITISKFWLKSKERRGLI